MKRRISAVAAVAGLLLTAAVGRAQVLTEQVPADAMVYAGWAGTDTLGPAYDASHLKALLATLKLPEFIEGAINEEMGKETDPQKVEDGKVVKAWVAAMAKSPTAVYVGPVEFAVAGKPQPRVALFSKVGAETAGALAGKLQVLLNRQNAPDAPVHGAVAAGEYLLIYVGETGMQARLAGAPSPADGLGASPAFQAAMGHLDGLAKNGAAVVYVDGPRVMGAIEGAVRTSTPEVRQYAPAVLNGLGLPSVREGAWAGAFDGANWRSAGFVGMAGRRVGLLSFLDNAALTEGAYKLIPQTATVAGVWRFDGSRLLGDITELAAAISDRGPQQMETVFQQVYAFLGVDVKKDLLPSLGTEWVYYGSPDVAGNSMRGLTLVNRLKDAGKAETALTAIETLANIMIVQRDPNTKAQFKTEQMPAPFETVTAHVIPVGRVTPAWAIADGTLFVSMGVPGLQSAMEMAGVGKGGVSGKPSILENAQFMGLRKALKQEGISGFQYSDVGKGLPETYELVSGALAEALTKGGVKRAYTLPPLDKVMADVGPVLKVSWTDGEGFHTREAGPFPFAMGLSPVNLMMMRAGEMLGAGSRGGAGAEGVGLP